MSNNPQTQSALFMEEQADPAVDARGFRRALGQFATGVTVVTTNTAGGPVGMAVNSFAAVSLDPPLISWSIRNESKNLAAFSQREHFAISVLADDQVDACSIFGRPQDGQFDSVPWSPSMHGDPLLDEAIAHFECTLENVHLAGDHHILVGRVHRFTRFAGHPLLFSQGQYKVAVEHPQLENTAASDAAGSQSSSQGQEPLFVSLLKTTDRYLLDQFEEYREQLGLRVADSSVINLLDQSPSTAEQLATGALMRVDAILDTLADLQAKNLVDVRAGLYELTAKGRQMRAALLASAASFNERLISQINSQDLETTRRVLMQLLSN